MKVILSVIAVCLVMITAKLYIPEASADVDDKGYMGYVTDMEFARAVAFIVQSRCVSPSQQFYVNGMYANKPQVGIYCNEPDLINEEKRWLRK